MSPALTGQPWKSASFVALRASAMVIECIRNDSSMHAGISDGSSRICWRTSGCSARYWNR